MRALVLLCTENSFPVLALIERLSLLQEEQLALNDSFLLSCGQALLLLLCDLRALELLLDRLLLSSVTGSNCFDLCDLLLRQSDHVREEIRIVGGKRREGRASALLLSRAAHSLLVFSRQLSTNSIVVLLLSAFQLSLSSLEGCSSLCSCDRVRSVKSGLIEGSRAECRGRGDLSGSRLGRLRGWLLLLTLLLTGSVGRKGLQLRWGGGLTAGSCFRRRCSLLLLL